MRPLGWLRAEEQSSLGYTPPPSYIWSGRLRTASPKLSARPVAGAPAGRPDHFQRCRLKHSPPLQVEGDVFATSGSDRGIALYDLRSATPIRKLVMQV